MKQRKQTVEMRGNDRKQVTSEEMTENKRGQREMTNQRGVAVDVLDVQVRAGFVEQLDQFEPPEVVAALESQAVSRSQREDPGKAHNATGGLRVTVSLPRCA